MAKKKKIVRKKTMTDVTFVKESKEIGVSFIKLHDCFYIVGGWHEKNKSVLVRKNAEGEKAFPMAYPLLIWKYMGKVKLYDNNWNELYLGSVGRFQKMCSGSYLNDDCMHILPTLKNNEYHTAIVDPPYGIGYDKKASAKSGAVYNGIQVPRGDYPKTDWDNKIPSDKYFEELERVSEKRFVFGGNYFKALHGLEPFKSPKKAEFKQFLKDHPKHWIIWDKCNGDNDFSDCELIWSSEPIKSYILPYMWSGMMQGKSITEGKVQQGNKKLNQKRIHPTEKPVILYRHLLQKYVPKTKKVLDTFGGSASILVALELEKRKDYLIVEMNEEYYKTGLDRHYKECQQLRLNL